MRRRLIYWFFLFLLFVGVAAAFSSVFLPASTRPRRTVVDVPPRASLPEIARLLQEKRVIRNHYAFQLMTRVLGESTNLKAGEYELSPHLSLIEIIDKIARGDAISHWVTIPEGYTLEQIARTLAKQRMAEERRFLKLARAGGDDVGAPGWAPRGSLEGYLFPDTYRVKAGASEKAILRTMLATFDEKVVKELSHELRLSPLSLDKIIILASLIEREARVPEDRPLISAVIHNRLKEGMRLQVDATVLYALGRHKSKVLYEDLKTPSRYNTYRHAGLPPGPICNPGLRSIEAALKPAKTDYLFYVARPDGSHIFSRTYEEHQKATRVARALGRTSEASTH
jgi:UPF0755 protein